MYEPDCRDCIHWKSHVPTGRAACAAPDVIGRTHPSKPSNADQCLMYVPRYLHQSMDNLKSCFFSASKMHP